MLGKLAEAFILDGILTYTEAHNILPDMQHGFRKDHSCETQLLKVIESVKNARAKKQQITAVYIDIEKAFDRIIPSALVLKLYRLSFPSLLALLVGEFLRSRRFFVVVEGSISTRKLARAGLPQGSLLLPILFTLYIQDIPPPTVNIYIALFADDTAILSKGKTVNESVALTNSYLVSYHEWATKWDIKINVTKSAAMVFGQQRLKQQPPRPVDNGAYIDYVETYKYFGVTVDKGLKFQAHIEDIVSRASKLLFRLHPVLNRNSKLSLRSKLVIFKATSKAIVSYTAPVWGHAAAIHINKIQVFQNKALRMMVGAPWFVTNKQLHEDTPLITAHFQSTALKFYQKCDTHYNPTISQLNNYIPLSRVRRPRRILL